jgi:hypothetical protein
VRILILLYLLVSHLFVFQIKGFVIRIFFEGFLFFGCFVIVFVGGSICSSHNVGSREFSCRSNDSGDTSHIL